MQFHCPHNPGKPEAPRQFKNKLLHSLKQKNKPQISDMYHKQSYNDAYVIMQPKNLSLQGYNYCEPSDICLLNPSAE